MEIKCPKCNSENININDPNFASRKNEGEPAKKWCGKIKTEYFCWDCEYKWEENK